MAAAACLANGGYRGRVAEPSAGHPIAILAHRAARMIVTGRPDWHGLLAPLPAGVASRRRPVGAAEATASPDGSAIAGWLQVVVEASAGLIGHRVALVVLDSAGRPIAASDHVLFRDQPPGQPIQIRQESIGGRFDEGGEFHGTCWLTVGPEPAGDDPPNWDSTPRTPSDGEVAALRRLVAEVLSR